MNAFRVLVQQILKQDATENERYKATNNAVLAIRNYQNKKAQVPNSSAAASVNVTRGNAAPTTKKSFMAGVVGKLSNLKTRLTAPRVKAEAMNVASAISLAARVRARFRRVTGVTTGTPPHVEFNKAENYFKTQPNSNRVAANKLQAGAKKRLLGGWNYGVNNSRKSTFWKEYNALDKNLENMARTRNFTRYIPLGRNANKNIKKYPKYTQFFTNVKNLPGLNTRRNALLAQQVGILPNQISAFNKSVDDLLKQYNKYKGYEPVGMSAGQLRERTAGHKARLQSTANRTVFKGFANKGPAEYRLAKKRNVASNRKAYGTDPEFKKFWANYNKSEAALKLGAAKAAAVAAANKASVANITVVNATAAAANAARAAAEARTHFNKTNRTTVLRSVRDAANTASKRAQASLAAAKKREAAAAATKAAANAAATKAAANAQKAEENRAKANDAEKAAKVKAIVKALANLLSMRNSANAQAKKGDVEGVTKLKNSANKLKVSVNTNNSGANATQRSTAIRLADETAAYIDVAKHIKFIQEVWSRTRGSGAGNAWRVKKEVTPAELTQITHTYFIKNNLNNNNKQKIKNFIPNKPVSGSIIGWQGLLRRPDGNYNNRKKYLKKILNINQTPAAAPPPPPPTGPPPGTRGAGVASIADPVPRAIPARWMLNTNYKAYSKNLVSNIYAKKNTNTTYRKVNNATGSFSNQTNYMWNAADGNFKP